MAEHFPFALTTVALRHRNLASTQENPYSGQTSVYLRGFVWEVSASTPSLELSQLDAVNGFFDSLLGTAKAFELPLLAEQKLSPFPLTQIADVLTTPEGVRLQLQIAGEPYAVGQKLRVAERVHSVISRDLATRQYELNPIPTVVQNIQVHSGGNLFMRVRLLETPRIVVNGDWIEPITFNCKEAAEQELIVPFPELNALVLGDNSVLELAPGNVLSLAVAS